MDVQRWNQQASAPVKSSYTCSRVPAQPHPRVETPRPGARRHRSRTPGSEGAPGLPRRAPLGRGEGPWWAEPRSASQWKRRGGACGRERAEGRGQRQRAGRGGGDNGRRTNGGPEEGVGERLAGAGRAGGRGLRTTGGRRGVARGRAGQWRRGAGPGHGGGAAGGGARRRRRRRRRTKRRRARVAERSRAQSSRAEPGRAGPGRAQERAGDAGGQAGVGRPLNRAPRASEGAPRGHAPQRPARHGRGQLRGALVGEPPAPAAALRPALGDHQQSVPARGHRLPAGDARPRLGGQGPGSRPVHPGGGPAPSSRRSPSAIGGHGSLLVGRRPLSSRGSPPGSRVSPLRDSQKPPIPHRGSAALLQTRAFLSGVSKAFLSGGTCSCLLPLRGALSTSCQLLPRPLSITWPEPPHLPEDPRVLRAS